MLIEKRVSAPQNAAKTPLTYADAAKIPPPPPQAVLEKFVPSRLFSEVTVQPIDEVAPQQPSPRVVEAINKARIDRPGKVIAARRLESGDVLVTADSPSTKALLEEDTAWTTVIAGRARVKGRRFLVMAHAVKVSRVDPNEQAKSISNLESQNPSLKSRVKILRVAWLSKTLKLRKTHGPLLLEVGTPGEANILVQEGMLHDGELKDCELFIEECRLTQCYRCRQYGHTAKTCKGRRNCGYCAKEHDTRSCPTSETPSTHLCSNCKGKHVAWSKLCPERVARAARAAAAYAARPTFYKIPAKLSPSFPSTPSPPPPTPQPTPLQAQPTPTQTTGQVPNPAPVHGKRTRANSNSQIQSLSKKSCASSSSSSSLFLHATHSKTSQAPSASQPQPDARPRLRPRSLCIMKASNTASPDSDDEI
jgi:hypothetical protein